MKVLFLTNIPSPYMVNFFNELGNLCDLTVIFEKANASNRDSSWKGYKFSTFKGIILRGIVTAHDKAFCPQVIKYLNNQIYDVIVVTNPATPTGVIAIQYMKLFKISYIMESEGGFAKNGKGLKEKLKKHIITGAKLYLSTNRIGDEYFIAYGAEKNRIVKYPFTSIYNKDIVKFPVTYLQKKEIRNKLNVRYEKVVVAVGRFIPLKYYDVLIKAFRSIDKNAKLFIIGGGEERENYEKLISEYKLENIELIDFLLKDELNLYYQMADLFVHPTSTDCWGLIINEAMAFGLPIITTDMCIAGVELVKDYENGFIVPVGNEEKLSEKINIILKDDCLREEMSRKSLEKIQSYTFENMAKRHIEIFNDLVSSH